MKKCSKINSSEVTQKQNNKSVTRNDFPEGKKRDIKLIIKMTADKSGRVHPEDTEKASEGLRVLASIIARIEDERKRLKDK